MQNLLNNNNNVLLDLKDRIKIYDNNSWQWDNYS